MKKSIGILTILIIAFIALPSEMNAQYGKKKKRPVKTDETEQVENERKSSREPKAEKNEFQILEKLWFGLNITNPNINNQFLTLGLGPMASYKFTPSLSAGIISDFNYVYVWNRFGSAENYLDYSVGVYGRARFLRQFFGHVEYNYTSLDRIDTSAPRTTFPVLFLGGGYTSGRPPWGFEATLLFDVLGNLQRYKIPFVYRIGVTYNF